MMMLPRHIGDDFADASRTPCRMMMHHYLFQRALLASGNKNIKCAEK